MVGPPRLPGVGFLPPLEEELIADEVRGIDRGRVRSALRVESCLVCSCGALRWSVAGIYCGDITRSRRTGETGRRPQLPGSLGRKVDGDFFLSSQDSRARLI